MPIMTAMTTVTAVTAVATLSALSTLIATIWVRDLDLGHLRYLDGSVLGYARLAGRTGQENGPRNRQ
jgi:hypothetical protein